MDLTAAIDLYCERTTTDFFSEPLNLVSNAGFFVAAWFGQRSAQRRGLDQDVSVRLLLGLLVAIGVGSSLFHGFANTWSQAADVIPIAVFVGVYSVFLPRRGYRWSWPKSLIVPGFLILTTWKLSRYSLDLFNGSQMYFGAWLTMIALIPLRSQWSGPPLRPYHHGAALLFALALMLRMVDLRLCKVWPWGSHFGWHFANAGVLALLICHYLEVYGWQTQRDST